MILENNFHHTTYTTNKTREQLEAITARFLAGTATKSERAYIRRVRNALCGTSGCVCFNSIFGERR